MPASSGSREKAKIWKSNSLVSIACELHVNRTQYFFVSLFFVVGMVYIK